MNKVIRKLEIKDMKTLILLSFGEMFFDNAQNQRSKRNSQLGERIIKQLLVFINMLTRLLSVLRPGIRKFIFSESILELVLYEF